LGEGQHLDRIKNKQINEMGNRKQEFTTPTKKCKRRSNSVTV
jgi:hypothetical protein